MIDKATADEIRARIERNAEWFRTSPLVSRARNGAGSYKPEDCPEECRVDNAESSALEVYDFYTTPPERAFVYVRIVQNCGYYGLRSYGQVTTWVGDKLGDLTLGDSYRDNFGGTRRAVTVKAINGAVYVGTYYQSAGDYARIRMSAADRWRLARQ